MHGAGPRRSFIGTVRGVAATDDLAIKRLEETRADKDAMRAMFDVPGVVRRWLRCRTRMLEMAKLVMAADIYEVEY